MNEHEHHPHHPRLTDDAIDELRLAGRSELLEEIMNESAHDAGATRSSTGASRTTRWLAPLAAAAVVAGLATIPLWTGSDDGSSNGVAGQPSSTPTDAAASGADLIVLDAPGWRVEDVDEGGYGIAYQRRGAELEITSRPERLYDEYVDDRSNISSPPAPGEPVEVVGVPAQLWAYSGDDHTVIREPEAGRSYEIRGSGISRAAFLDLLTELRLVDRAGLEATLPEVFVTSDERAAVLRQTLDGIADALAPYGLVPEGEPEPRIASQNADRYNLGAEVSGVVACGWLEEYDDARAAGDDAAAAEAADAMSTSRDWPILREMETEGGYPLAIYEYADDMVAGKDVAGYESGLGCS